MDMPRRLTKCLAFNDEGQKVSPDYVDRDGLGWWKENSIPTSGPVVWWIGLIDYKGIEVYEGDIVKFNRTKDLYEVKWDAIHARFALFKIGRLREMGSGFGVQNASRYVVVGNRTQNPEMLR